MAKAATVIVMLVNQDHDTPTKYMTHVTTKGAKSSEKLRLKKYDPVVQKHCNFGQKKLPSPKSR
jgi:ribosomal protein L33